MGGHIGNANGHPLHQNVVVVINQRTTVNLGLAASLGFLFQRPGVKGLDMGRVATAAFLAASIGFAALPTTLPGLAGNTGNNDPRPSGPAKSERRPTSHGIHLRDATYHATLATSGPELIVYAPPGGAGRVVHLGGAGRGTHGEGSSSGNGGEGSNGGDRDQRGGNNQGAAGSSGEGPPPPNRVGVRRSERIALHTPKVYSEPKKKRAKPVRDNGGPPPPPPPPPPPAAAFGIDDGRQDDMDYLTYVPLDVLVIAAAIYAGYRSLTQQRTMKRPPKRDVQKYLESMEAYNAMHDGDLYHPCHLPEVLSSICPNTDPALWPLAYYGRYMEQEYGNPYRIWVMHSTLPQPEHAFQASDVALARGTDATNGVYALTFRVSMERAIADIADINSSPHAAHFAACAYLYKMLLCVGYALLITLLGYVAWAINPASWDNELGYFAITEFCTPRRRTPAQGLVECKSCPNLKWGPHVRIYADGATQVTPERAAVVAAAEVLALAAIPALDKNESIRESVNKMAVEDVPEDVVIEDVITKDIEVFEEVFEDASDEMDLEDVVAEEGFEEMVAEVEIVEEEVIGNEAVEELVLEDVAEEQEVVEYAVLGNETVDYMLTQDEANAVEVFQNDAVEAAIRDVLLDTSEFDMDINPNSNHEDDNNSVFVYIPSEYPPQPVDIDEDEEEEVANFLYPGFVDPEVNEEDYGYDVFGEKKDVVISDEERSLNDKCTTLTVADAVDGDKATTLPSDTKDVMEKLDKGKQRVLEEDNEESLDYDIRHVDDTFANYRASSPALARNESRTVLVEKEKETVTPTENEMSSTPTVEAVVDAVVEDNDEEKNDELPVKREKVPGRRHRKRPNKKTKDVVIDTENKDPSIMKRNVLTIRNTVEKVVEIKTTTSVGTDKQYRNRSRNQRWSKKKTRVV